MVIEHISGNFIIGENEVVDSIFAFDDYQQVYLPVHFASRPLDFGGWIGRMIQFGGPVRMYVAGNQQLHIRGDSNITASISAWAVGNLISP